MEILKNCDSSWSMKVTCTGFECSDYPCFSELLITKDDIVRLYTGSAHYGFICPICYQFTEIDNNLLPFSVKAHAPRIAEKGPLYERLKEDCMHKHKPLSEKEEKLCEIVIVTDYHQTKTEK